jgi:hypothetical protein
MTKRGDKDLYIAVSHDSEDERNEKGKFKTL